MSDIADKIYAATGLTLNAEAAAAIEKMIQAESEKLQATLNFAVTSHHEAVNTVISLVAERDTLRAALHEIERSHIPDQPAAFEHSDLDWARLHVGKLRSVARAALGEKE